MGDGTAKIDNFLLQVTVLPENMFDFSPEYARPMSSFVLFEAF